jgi:hypothetical protein
MAAASQVDLLAALRHLTRRRHQGVNAPPTY